MWKDLSCGQKEETGFLGEGWQNPARGAPGQGPYRRSGRGRTDARRGPSRAEADAQADQTLCSSANLLQRGGGRPVKTRKTVLLGRTSGGAHGEVESPACPGWGAHHLLQLVLDLPVDLCHLEEHVSCKDKTWGAGLKALSLGVHPRAGAGSTPLAGRGLQPDPWVLLAHPQCPPLGRRCSPETLGQTRVFCVA